MGELIGGRGSGVVIIYGKGRGGLIPNQQLKNKGHGHSLKRCCFRSACFPSSLSLAISEVSH